MKKYLNDPVLSLTASTLGIFRWAAFVLAGIMFVLSALVSINVVAILLGIYTPPEGPLMASKNDFFFTLGFLLTTGSIFYLMMRFLKALRELVLSVGEGQPLTLINAARLRLMGWISIGTQGIIILMMAFGLLGEALEFDVDIIYDIFEGILIAAVLFILARVFEQGARMQEELEGTV